MVQAKRIKNEEVASLLDALNDGTEKQIYLQLSAVALEDYTIELINMLIETVRRTQNVHLTGILLDKLTRIKTSFFPATTASKNVNYNIDVFDKQLSAWRKEREALMKTEKEMDENLKKEKADKILKEGFDDGE